MYNDKGPSDITVNYWHCTIILLLLLLTTRYKQTYIKYLGIGNKYRPIHVYCTHSWFSAEAADNFPVFVVFLVLIPHKRFQSCCWHYFFINLIEFSTL